MKLISQSVVLAIFVAGAAHGITSRQSPAQQREPAGPTKMRDQRQPGVSAQTAPNCSGRPGARCAKKGGVKKLRTIF
jgi:hypothetical protein